MKKLACLLSLLVLILLTSCLKKYGCTNQKAVNFDPEAELRDMSCYFLQNFRLEWSDYTEEQWIDNGYDSIAVLINNEMLYGESLALGTGLGADDMFYFQRLSHTYTIELNIKVVADGNLLIHEQGFIEDVSEDIEVIDL